MPRGKDSMRQRIKEEARTHGDGCDCMTCRAAAGDEDAMNQLLKELI